MRCTTVAILLTLVALPLYAAQSPEIEVAEALADLGRAARSGKPGEVRSHVDEDRLLGEVRTWANLDALDPKQVSVYRGSMEYVVAEIRRWADSRTDLLDVRMVNKGAEAILIARHIYDGDETMRLRWRFAKTDGAWGVFDVGPIGYHMPLSLVLASGLDLLSARTTEEDLIPVSALAQAGEALYAGKTDVARKLLESIEGDELPPRIDGVREVMTATLHVFEDRPDEALAALDRAEAHNPGMPFVDCLRAQALNRKGEFERALTFATKYLTATAGEAAGFHQAGLSLARLGREEEAVAAFEKALVDAPKTLALMARPLTTPEWSPALAALVAAGHTVTPRDPNLDFLDVQADSLAGRHVAAAAKLHPLLEKIADPTSLDAWRRYYLDEMIAAGRPLSGAAALADWPGALVHVGNELMRQKDVRRLRALVLTHAERYPKDPWLDYFEGEALMLSGDYEKAEAAFKAGAQDVADEAVREEFRAARVYNLHLAGRALGALETVGPRGRTLRQLIWLCGEAGDDAGIAELLAAQAKAGAMLPSYLFCASEPAWRAGRWDEAVAQLLARRKEILADPELLYDFEDRVIRGLLRSGRHEDALRAARAIEKRDDDLWYVALSLAATGRAEETRKTLSRLRLRGFTRKQMQADEDLAKALAAKGMGAVREEFAPPAK